MGYLSLAEFTLTITPQSPPQRERQEEQHVSMWVHSLAKKSMG